MNSWYYLHPSAIPEETCQKIKKIFDQNNRPGLVDDGSLNKNIRDSNVSGFGFGHPQNKEFDSLLLDFVTIANRECFGFHLNGVNEYQLTQYNKSGFYGSHMDLRVNDSYSERKLSLTLQLSDPKDYEGGNFVFNTADNPPAEKLKEIGTLLIFPAFLLHEVTEVTSGSRYSLVGWYEGNKFI